MDGSGKEAKEGVYYWVVQYEELSLSGNIAGAQKGWVLLMR